MASGDELAKWDARAGFPPSSNYATFLTRNTHPAVLHDDTTSESWYFEDVMPTFYGAGNITVEIHWTAVSATSGTGGWLVAFENIAESQDLDSDGFGSDQTVTAVTVPGTSGQVKISTLTVTAGSATDSVAAGKMFRLKVSRDTANDTATGDLELRMVRLLEA